MPKRVRPDEPEAEHDRSVSRFVATLTELAPVTAGVGLLVYVLGGAVLFARLALADLPEKTVVGYLPREFLMMLGISEVFVPGAVAAAAHAAWRTFGPLGEPKLSGRRIAAAAAAWTVVVLLAVIVIAHRAGVEEAHSHVDRPAFWILGLGACVVAVCGAALVRWRLQARPLHVLVGPEWLTHTLAYGLAAMVVATVVAVTVPLPDARLCMNDGTAQSGSFIGESDARIFLGEDVPRRPRIALVDIDEVDLMFIGHDAGSASCD